jgi:hypothetical protein
MVVCTYVIKSRNHYFFKDKSQTWNWKRKKPKLKYAHPKHERHLLITNVEIKPTYLGNVARFQC